VEKKPALWESGHIDRTTKKNGAFNYFGQAEKPKKPKNAKLSKKSLKGDVIRMAGRKIFRFCEAGRIKLQGSVAGEGGRKWFPGLRFDGPVPLGGVKGDVCCVNWGKTVVGGGGGGVLFLGVGGGLGGGFVLGGVGWVFLGWRQPGHERIAFTLTGSVVFRLGEGVNGI